MKAIILKEAGSSANLYHTELPLPEIKENEVLVKVKAISVNPIDVKARANEGVLTWIFNEERPVILGWDISGAVSKTGSQLSDFKIGDEVFGMVNFFGQGKAYAEYVAVPANQLALKPADISHEEAAAATLAALTALQVLNHAKVSKGQKVLIHAASGGVGHYAVQLAKNIGAFVIGTSSAANKDFVLGLGADEHIDYTSERFEELVTDADFVLDTMEGETLTRSIDAVKPGGMIISIPTGNFPQSDKDKAQERNVNLSELLVKSNGRDMKTIADLLEKGILKSHVSKTFDFKDMDKAHQSLETGRTKGKVVVTLSAD
ncbi:NADP-dependent oxidoreductase [Pedobacter gandavensis]|uniref:NADP-dependent oxidoreductase n=1 Tax=Pedobacter gandavensis TaxID=2679963 RepID=UPI00292F2CB3|nr:NADP-dependent oxidoreductase [Pedobacter gandavensis]